MRPSDLTEPTFVLFAAKHYDNPHCEDVLEFEEDLKRFMHVKKALARYKQVGELKERLVLNHLIVLYNCFGAAATPMLFMKLEGHHEALKPFVDYLNYLPEMIEYGGKRISKGSIRGDTLVEALLRRI